MTEAKQSCCLNPGRENCPLWSLPQWCGTSRPCPWRTPLVTLTADDEDIIRDLETIQTRYKQAVVRLCESMRERMGDDA